MQIIGKNIKLDYPHVITIGNFDGLHAGHRKLIAEAAAFAKETGAKTGLLSFYPHPAAVLGGSKDFKMIYSLREKQFLLEETGIDTYIEYPFTRELASLEPEDFVKSILIGRLNMTAVAVGGGFRFGSKSTGDVKSLAGMAENYGFGLRIVKEDRAAGINSKISSSIIRELIIKGELKFAAKLLARSFFILAEGKEINGKIVLYPGKNKLLPPLGKYITKICVFGKSYRGTAQVGSGEVLLEGIPSLSGEYFKEIFVEF